MKHANADPITMVYHELRGPLGLMATAARSAAEDCTDDGLRARCEVIVRAAERMLRTAGLVMDLAQATATESFERFNPVETVRATVANFHGLNVRVILTELTSEASYVSEGNEVQLEALIQSLMTNASDHAEPGTGINVLVSERSSALRIEFVNQTSSRPRHLGLGLGLFICENLVERLGASIIAEERGGHFHTVLTVPLASRPMEIAV